ncbi:carboxymuconolactone decarboxylase family protein [Mangrovitalea sediminis]|uniref:carboxymuconolactone decarboxylase family protein n=1 Tax=Mangrovitalea sediminis TaxID=1982043 RepID=UPI000BE56780|nr:carboxymuconolactone decarboxylase family protein [Mangrovitalea sediminis]
MEPRLELHRSSPKAYASMLAMSEAVSQCGLEKSLQELVKIRASQINGCAFCLNMHAQAARQLGESVDRLMLVAAWRDTNAFTPREKAALAWTEALTALGDGVADTLYADARAQFSEEELTNLTLAIAHINAWNRFGVAFQLIPPVSANTSADEE